jgi:arsenite-transporting ATPase
MKKNLGDPKVCTVRLVLNLEKMVIKEAQRAFTYLSLYDYLTDAVIVNRILPPEVKDVFFAHWHESQARNLELVNSAFAPVPILHTTLYDHEMTGLDNLATMAEELYGERDPVAIFHTTVPQTIKKVNGAYELSLQLPFATKEELGVTRREGDLFVTVGPYKREMSLPRALHNRPVTKAKLDAGTLLVTFGAAKR